MKQLFVIRHGETDNNKAKMIQGRSINAPINALGKRQALAIVEVLDTFSIQKIVASSLDRTHQTAEPLATKLGLDSEKHTDLDEIDFGELEGQEFQLIESQINMVHTKWSSGEVDFAVEGGESPRQVFDRANKRIQHILSTSEEENIVFVIHGRLIRILLSEWLGHGLKNMHLIEHQNGAINHLTWQNGEFKAVELNKTAHLGDLG
ncbi:MAG: histidine phosphatase family protein [Balneolaceae bacterium]